MASQENLRDGGITLTILGCGTMGIAILSGILANLDDLSKGVHSNHAVHQGETSGPSTPMEEMPPSSLPSRFIACTRRPESAKRVHKLLSQYQSVSKLETSVNDNVSAVGAADVILLGCKPQMFREVLGAPGIREALEGKLLISILAGVTTEQIELQLYPELAYSDSSLPSQSSSFASTTAATKNAIITTTTTSGVGSGGGCRVVRVMPNTASFVRESMTVIESSSPPLPPDWNSLVTWVFSSIGRVVHLPPSSMDASTALCGSGPAFAALVLEALADGGVAMGLPRAEAQLMAAQVMMGTASLVVGGEHPAILRDKVSTPGGCTIGGLLVLEEGRVRGSVARAVREATVVASQLGKGVVGVNGTRFGTMGKFD